MVLKYLTVLLLAATLGLAGTTPDKKEPAATVEKSTAEKQPAKEKKEKKAKRKLRQTPFGPVEVKDAPPAPPKPKTLAESPFITVEEKGETVIFKRKTPFGNQVWKKERSELTADELELLNRSRDVAAGPEAPAAGKPAPAAKGASAKPSP